MDHACLWYQNCQLFLQCFEQLNFVRARNCSKTENEPLVLCCFRNYAHVAGMWHRGEALALHLIHHLHADTKSSESGEVYQLRRRIHILRDMCALVSNHCDQLMASQRESGRFEPPRESIHIHTEAQVKRMFLFQTRSP